MLAESWNETKQCLTPANELCCLRRSSTLLKHSTAISPVRLRTVAATEAKHENYHRLPLPEEDLSTEPLVAISPTRCNNAGHHTRLPRFSSNLHCSGNLPLYSKLIHDSIRQRECRSNSAGTTLHRHIHRTVHRLHAKR